MVNLSGKDPQACTRLLFRQFLKQADLHVGGQRVVDGLFLSHQAVTSVLQCNVPVPDVVCLEVEHYSHHLRGHKIAARTFREQMERSLYLTHISTGGNAEDFIRHSDRARKVYVSRARARNVMC